MRNLHVDLVKTMNQNYANIQRLTKNTKIKKVFSVSRLQRKGHGKAVEYHVIKEKLSWCNRVIEVFLLEVNCSANSFL